MDNTKKCTKCGRELSLDQFRKRKYSNGSIGYYAECRDCSNKRNAKYYQNNREKVLLRNTRWRKNNPDKEKDRHIRWQKNNVEKKRLTDAAWQRNNREKCRAAGRRWRQANSKYLAEYNKLRKKRNPDRRLAGNIRSAIWRALNNNIKADHTEELLGCSIEYLRHYLENQFTGSMNWDNYGPHGWHIDHIIPLSYFDLSDPEQQRRVWHYTNLRPMWAKDNIRKSNKIIEIQLVLL